MKILMTGGTGFVGSYLTEGLIRSGHDVTVLTRSAEKRRHLPEGASFLESDPKGTGPWQEQVADHDVIINLAGTSIFRLWTANARESIVNSRVFTTRNLVDALARSPGRGILLISASAVGYYGSREDDKVLDENSPPGNDFLAAVSLKWESEAMRAEDFGARVAITRFGIVLGRGGGALAKMVPAFKHYAGSALGSGKQWFSWIHQEDLLNIMLFILDREGISGPVNCTAPSPVRNKEFTQTLARVLGKPQIMPSVPGFLVKTLLGDFGDVILKGQRVIPRKLLDAGYQFRFPTLRNALKDLL